MAAALTAAVGDIPDLAVILAVVGVNTALGAAQEARSERALEALALLTAPSARVVRDGVEQEIDAAEVVRGDLLSLAAGDVVPADGEVADAASLACDESMLTGESVPVGKLAGDPVRSGTVVVRGRGAAVVTATGSATAAGEISRGVSAAAATTPLQRQLAVLGRRLTVAVAIAAVAVALIARGSGRGVETSLVLGVSLAVAAIPESLPAVVSLALSAAAHRLSVLGVLTRRLSAVEALGSVTVLALDKTGTVTEGRLRVDRLWTPTGTAAERCLLVEAGALCNDACFPDGRTPASHDDPLEVALVAAAREEGVDVAALRARRPRTGEEPFDAALARMTTTHAGSGTEFAIVKGAPEQVVPGDDDVLRTAQEWAAQGIRVLAVGVDHGPGLELLGLVGFRDPARPDAAEVLQAFRDAGVRPVMVTGDHALTAQAVATEVGIGGDSVHARVAPSGKRVLVQALRERGDVVAMTGDGVNDAPALRAADVGVAVGERATEVARQAADLVLTRNDLLPLVHAIAEGRRAYDNIRRFLVYAMAGGLAEVLVMLTGPLAGFDVPLLAGQILWVNLLTHGLPGVAMGSEPAAPDVLARPPRHPAEQLLDGASSTRIALLAALVTATSVAAGLWGRHAGIPWQACIFLALVLAQLAIALGLRPARAGRDANPLLPAAVAVNVGLLVLAAVWGPLRDVLRLPSLTAGELGQGLLLGVLCALPAGLGARALRR